MGAVRVGGSPSRNRSFKRPPFSIPNVRRRRTRRIVIMKITEGKTSCPIQKAAKTIRKIVSGPNRKGWNNVDTNVLLCGLFLVE